MATKYTAAPACTMVVFGAGGDLTKRLVTPALYNLAVAGMLSDDFHLLGVDIADLDDAKWRDSLGNMIRAFVSKDGGTVDEKALSWLTEKMAYIKGDFSDVATFKTVGEHMGSGNVLFYLAVADRFFGPLVEMLGRAELVTEKESGPWRRVIIEKPFGHDLASAKALNAQILRVLGEDQIYRMDHFLGKETVQNIMMLRFGNGVFESLWNRDHIDHVQITVAETVGVERRGKFYEHTGALRDMVPNHVFQLLAVTAMEPPISFDADPVRAEKAKVLQAIHLLDSAEVARDCVRGQYGPGHDGDKEVPGYRQEPDVSPDSQTETYIALKLVVDNWRWAGIPFYIRTGKHMAARRTEIMVQFRPPPFTLFRDTSVESLAPNRMILHIQPDEGISLLFNAKIPGPAVNADGVRMDFRYKDFFSHPPSTGYETLLYDCMIGEATLFQRADFVEAGWRIVQPILDAWQSTPVTFPNYESGGQGPAAADELLERDGRAWRELA